MKSAQTKLDAFFKDASLSGAQKYRLLQIIKQANGTDEKTGYDTQLKVVQDLVALINPENYDLAKKAIEKQAGDGTAAALLGASWEQQWQNDGQLKRYYIKSQ